MSILVDTSVWIEHLRSGDAGLKAALRAGEVLVHPLVIGELACGSLQNRTEVLSLLGELPAAKTAEHEEVLRLIESRRLFGLGLGFIDAHLIASALLSKAKILTRDKLLGRTAATLGLD